VNNKPRRPWVAAILTLLTTGLGHLYAGEAKRGLVLFGINQFLPFVGALAFLFVTPNVFFLLLVIFVGLAFTVFCIVDAALTARRKKDAYHLKSYNKWYMYVAYFIALSFLISPLVSTVIRTDFVEAFKIPSGAMIPTLTIGDRLLVNKFIYGPRIPFTDTRLFTWKEPKRGEIIVFKYPEDETKNFIKRVIGAPGDKIQINDGTLFINDQPVPLVEKGYVRAGEESPGFSAYFPKPRLFEEQVGSARYHIQYLRNQRGYNLGPVLVPKDAVFVMGDNRDNSQDSRVWGFVKLNKILGRARSIYWSWDSNSGNVRWDRIGKSVQ
jgi:signal peptidase I